MRYRVAFATFMVLTGLTAGLTAPAASAAPDLPVNGCTVGNDYGPYILLANDNQGVGIHYNGPGTQATVTSIFDTGGPSNLYFKCVSGTGIIEYVIHNQNGNCLRMRDLSNGYAVMEENGCNTTDLNQRFVPSGSGCSGCLIAFQDDGEGQMLGVSCGVQDGWKVWGVRDVSGSCFRWKIDPQ